MKKNIKSDGSYTYDYHELKREILKYHFPFQDVTYYKFFNKDTADRYEGEIPKQEIELVIKEIKGKKATGYNNLKGDVLKIIYNVYSLLYYIIFNKIWLMEKF